MNKHQLIALSLMTSLCCVTPLTSAAQSAAAYARPLVSDTLQQLTMPTEKRIQLKRKPQIVKKKTVQFAQGLERRTVIVKFHDGTHIRASNPSDLNIGSSETRILLERLKSLNPTTQKMSRYDQHLLQQNGITEKTLATEIDRFKKLVGTKSLNRWGKTFKQPAAQLEKLRIANEKRTRRQSSDLANYYWFEFDQGTRGEQIATQLNQLTIVEDAYLAPIGKDAQDIAPTTPNFQVAAANENGLSQGYLNPAPVGIDANFAWTQTGGNGENITLVDVETGWIMEHEDLPDMVYQSGRVNAGDGNHGTAVMSIMLGLNDNAGVTGIVWGANGGVASVRQNYANTYFNNIANAVIDATFNLASGDVILIEQHAQFLMGEENCTACETATGRPSDSCGFVAMEYWSHIFDAISAASSVGIIVAEAAGNGQQNLDHERYERRFDRTFRNSGAIFVGAGKSGFSRRARAPECFTNHGSRLDLQGWGSQVMAAGYGELSGEESPVVRINGDDNRQWYRNNFNGTSSATPIVAGAIAAVQGVQNANGHPPLNWLEVRNLLRDTGSNQRAGVNIGPLPNLRDALQQLLVQYPAAEITDNGTPTVYRYDVELANNVVISNNVAGVNASQQIRLDAASFTPSPILNIPEPTDLAQRAIAGITLGERADKPCFAAIHTGNAVTNTASNVISSSICRNGSPTNRSRRTINPATTNDEYMVAMDVCLTSNGNNPARLKGVRMHRAKISANGTVTPVTGQVAEIERYNCNGQWEQTSCPANSIATELLIHNRADDNNTDRAERSFSGIQLGCKEVTTTRRCVSGCE